MPVRGPHTLARAFFMSNDPLNDAIRDAAQAPQAMSGDGITVSERSVTDMIAAKKFLDANDAVEGIASGQFGLLSILGRPPGAGGGSHGDC